MYSTNALVNIAELTIANSVLDKHTYSFAFDFMFNLLQQIQSNVSSET